MPVFGCLLGLDSQRQEQPRTTLGTPLVTIESPLPLFTRTSFYPYLILDA